MKTNIAEYVPDSREAGRQFNNGAGDHSRQKSFELVRAKDPDTEKILTARLEAITDAELTDGARNLFTFLLDLSLNPRVNNDRRGQIVISNTQLRERLHRSARAIYGWTKELEAQRHIWVTKLPRPNMHPMNVFHITALQSRREIRQEVPGDGMWGDGYRRPDQMMPLGARGGTCKKRHLLLDQFGRPAKMQVTDFAAPTRKACGSPPQVLREQSAQNDTGHPQVLRGIPAQNDTCPPQVLRGAPAQNDTRPPQKPAVLKESQTEKEGPLGTLSVQRGHAFKKGGENGYLSHVAQVLSKWSVKGAKAELQNSGAWWRMKFREDPDKAARVLAEIRRMITEGEAFTVNPGACAVDLWRRWA